MDRVMGRLLGLLNQNLRSRQIVRHTWSHLLWNLALRSYHRLFGSYYPVILQPTAIGTRRSGWAGSYYPRSQNRDLGHPAPGLRRPRGRLIFIWLDFREK